MDKSYLVTKSNYFIMNSGYDLSLEEQKIILTLASMVQPSDEEFKPYKFKISDFMVLLGIEDKSKYTEIPKITKELMKKVFEIHEGNLIIQIAWLSSAAYRKGTGTVELEFSPKLKPYMLQLKERFTQYQLANVLTMKSKYSPRIYEILKCNEFKKQGYVEIEIQELRNLLKIENIYPKYNDFKRKIILQAQKELKKLTDISFDFDEIKTGRKVTAIRFYIKSNSKNEIAATSSVPSCSDEENPEVHQRQLSFIQETLTPLDEKKIIDTAGGDIELIREKYEIAQYQAQCQGRDGHIENLVGWLIKAIKEDYKKPVGMNSKWKKPSSGSGERQYDPAELERQLLGQK